MGHLSDTEHHKNLVKSITAMANSGNPVAIAAASQLYASNSVQLDENVRKIVKMDPYTSFMIISKSLSHVPTFREHKYFNDIQKPRATLMSTIAFSVFAALFGKFMWIIRIRSSDELKKLMSKDKEQTATLRKIFLKKQTIGRAFFLLLLYDLVASHFLQYASGESLSFTSEIPIPRINKLKEYSFYYQPLTSVYPLVETTIFILGFLTLVRRYRYVVFPMILTGAYYHQDLWRAIPLLNYVVDESYNKVENQIHSVHDKTRKLLDTFGIEI